MTKSTVLVIEDDLELRRQLEWALGQTYTVCTAGDRNKALRYLEEADPFLVTLDLGLSPDSHETIEGFTVLRAILSAKPSAKVIVLTGRCDPSTARHALQCGAFDYLHKPVDIETLKLTLRRASLHYELEEEGRCLPTQSREETFHDLIGASAAMQQLFAKVRRVAPSDLSILLEGESGTGKELVARAIHQESNRRDGPFIAINCGAIPETLLESELFGHEKGSFTGAHLQRKGRIELADKGTLFLDEIGELSLGLQVKLLRFLQEHVVDRIGGRQSILVNTRVVAATNVDLVEALSRGTFRKDLFYRLNVVHLSMPPLRDRDQDATMLAQEFVLRYRALLNPRVVGLSQAARNVIHAYHWPGNVRELQNLIRRALVVAQGATLQPLDLGISTELSDESRLTLRAAREEFDKTLIRQTLARTNGNVARTAEALGLSRQAVYNLVERLGLSDRLALSRT